MFAKRECSGQIGAVIELLQGKLWEGVMRIMRRKGSGLFPESREIHMECSCPDWAGMCKHVAAAMYGVGARLDQQPQLLFTLRQLDHLELITDAGSFEPTTGGKSGRKTIHAGDVSEVFGIEMAPTTSESPATISDPPQVKKVRKSKRAAAPQHGKGYAEKANSSAKTSAAQAKRSKRTGR